MSFILGLLKVAHFFGLFMGGGSALGMAVIGLTAPSAPAEHRPTIGAMAKRFKMVSHIALGLLLVTGILLATIEGVWGAASVWFWIKLLAVAVLIAGIVLAGREGPKALQGDAEAGARAERFGKMNMVALVVILCGAVLAFG